MQSSRRRRGGMSRNRDGHREKPPRRREKGGTGWSKVIEALKPRLFLSPSLLKPFERERERGRIAPSRKVGCERGRRRTIKTDRSREREREKEGQVAGGVRQKSEEKTEGWREKEAWVSPPRSVAAERDHACIKERERRLGGCRRKGGEKEETKGDRVWAAISPSNGARNKTKERSVELKHNKAGLREDRRRKRSRRRRRWRREIKKRGNNGARDRVAVSLSFPIPFSFPRARLPNYLSLPPSFCPSTTTTPRTLAPSRTDR